MPEVVTKPRASARQQSSPGSLPVELSSFVGRSLELSEIKRLLQGAHAITLTGPGGIGKTRLAVRATRRLARHFPDGVRFVELAEIDSPELVAYALARSLSVQERRGEAIEEAVIAHLGERRFLLVLDNCEHVLDACRQLVASVVSRCERVRVLCTSRERLDILGEAVVALAPLGAEDEALQLLADRAAAVAPGFALTNANGLAASEICRRLDGLPLAIELAAVRLASMSVEDLRARLDDRLRLLAGRGIGPARSQTLRAAVDWSYELLSDEERLLWRRVSVFAGSFGLEAAEDVCSGAGLERERIVDLVGSLVAKSILTMGRGGRHGRYRLLETLRLYGEQRLAEAGEHAELTRRHAAWYAGLVSGEAQPWWAGPRQREDFERLDVEWANVEAALDLLTASEPDTGLRMAADLWIYWLVRGHYRAGISRLETLLELDPSPTPTRAMALWALAFIVQGTGDHAPPRALEALEEARRVCEHAGGERELAYVLHGIALTNVRMGRVDQAEEFAAEAQERMLRVDDEAGAAMCLFLLATVAGAHGSADARSLAEETVRASEQIGHEMFRGLANGLLGTIVWAQGDVRTAEERLEEAVRAQSAIGHRWGMLTSLGGLAWVAGTRGEQERAALLLGAGAALSNELGITLFPHAQVHQDACEAAARANLGEARFQDAWARGFALSREQVVALALEQAPAAGRPAPAAAVAELSDRELEVARLVASGLSNPAIAAELFLSRATIKTHVSHILGKLGLQSRAQIAGWVAGEDPNHPP